MERNFDLTMRLLDNGKFEIDLYDLESGDCVQISGENFRYGQHDDFNNAIGEEICSWLEIMAEEKEAMEIYKEAMGNI